MRTHRAKTPGVSGAGFGPPLRYFSWRIGGGGKNPLEYLAKVLDKQNEQLVKNSELARSLKALESVRGGPGPDSVF